jgi:hypothetical protein
VNHCIEFYSLAETTKQTIQTNKTKKDKKSHKLGITMSLQQFHTSKTGCDTDDTVLDSFSELTIDDSNTTNIVESSISSNQDNNDHNDYDDYDDDYDDDYYDRKNYSADEPGVATIIRGIGTHHEHHIAMFGNLGIAYKVIDEDDLPPDDLYWQLPPEGCYYCGRHGDCPC